MEKSSELKNFYIHFLKAYSSGESSIIERTMSQRDGVIAIGTDPNEWWVGYETIVKMYKTQIKDMSGMRIIAGDPQAYREGNVGWLVDRPKFKLPDGAEIAYRLTGVFLKDDKGWKIIQWHSSIGVRNEDAV